ncbi:MAG: exodeoxyribonuclease VII large subunit [Alphaproteobacteria bacterium]|nr:exodeoxyribonuclease VII large subunit [Alphaproteobacteria bacterium]
MIPPMNEPNPIRSNVPEFSVSDLAFSLKRTLEENYSRVRVRGELSRVSIPASGHMYSSLKDDQAVIDAVCWKGSLSKLSIRPEEGLEVICTGRITTYPARSNYQLVIETMELAGEGALLKMLEERKKKLAAEGLFAPERKKPLPFLPDHIGVVTSPTGAVIRDILHRLNDRFPRRVTVWPVMVQGEGAEIQITAAIDGFNTLPESQRPDVLIVARGGGSLEDLMPFNAESVVHAAANSQIPLISAVGHETDTTLIDYAADLRAPTPTGAAEMAVPVRLNLIAQISDNEKRLFSSLNRLLSENRHRLEALSAKLGDPAHLLEIQTQRLDRITEKMSGLFGKYLARKENALTHHGAALRPPKHLISEGNQRLTRWSETLETTAKKNVHQQKVRLESLSGMLELLSFENVLQRGFVVIENKDGKPVTNPDSLTQGQQITLRFKEKKTRTATINGTENQGSLF